jgi:hypothetical protein
MSDLERRFDVEDMTGEIQPCSCLSSFFLRYIQHKIHLYSKFKTIPILAAKCLIQVSACYRQQAILYIEVIRRRVYNVPRATLVRYLSIQHSTVLLRMIHIVASPISFMLCIRVSNHKELLMAVTTMMSADKSPSASDIGEFSGTSYSVKYTSRTTYINPPHPPLSRTTSLFSENPNLYHTTIMSHQDHDLTAANRETWE